jgi:transcriptional regulator with GAF, ATPase, and Fis domain/serine/threonine protein kinase/Tfp pilus assembly protein PilF
MELIGNRYELKRKLGSGSFGDVYLCHDRREDRLVCLKLLKDINPDGIANIIEEFKLLSNLEHPNLIRVYDFERDDKYGPYFTLEYASNGDLGRQLPFDFDKFLSAANAILTALAFIHSRNVIHGDLKPANILIDSSDNYRLSDFGLSFIYGGSERPYPSGSILYTAPEILRYERATIKSDIYSLGLLFYEILLGHSPYHTENSDEILSAKLRGENLIDAISAECGGDKMAQILRKMTFSEPSQRYQSVEDVANDLKSFRPDGESDVGISVIGRAKFVGRKEELTWLSNGLERWRQGENATFFIGGEAGIGKSWLIDEFRVRSQVAGYKFYRVYCREDDLRPFSPILKLLGYLFDELDPNLKRFSSYGPDLKKLFPVKFSGAGQQALSEADIKSGRRRLLDNLLQYLGDISSNDKAILAIEDVQWADSDTLDFLKLAFEIPSNSKDRALFLISTGQIHLDDTSPIFKPSNPTKLKILASPDRETWNQFLADLLGGNLPEDFSQRLLRETGGNFLFTKEVIKELVEAKLLRRLRGEWNLEADWPAKINVPQGIRPVIARRLNRLRPELRAVTDLAAVMDRSFLPEELRGLGVTNPEAYLLELIGLGVLGRIIIGVHERFDFSHGQLRRVSYELLNKETREEYHRKIANYFEKRGTEPEYLGHHYLEAKRFDKAYGYINSSARKAELLYAYHRAADFYRQALVCIENQPDSLERNDRLINIYLGLGKSLDFFSPTEATESLLKAVQLAELGNPEQLAEASIWAGNNYVHIGENEKAVPYFEKGLIAAREVGNSKLIGEAGTGLGFAYDKMGRLDEAEKSYLRALNALSEVDYPEASCRVLNYMGIVSKRRGDFNGALDFYRRALDISIQKKFLWSAMNLYGNLGNLYIAKGDLKSGLDYYIKSLQISEEISDRRIESINLLNIGHTFNEVGDLEQAEKHFFQAIHKLKELGDKGSEAIALNNLGLLYYRKGEIAKSIEHYQKGRELAREINQPRAELANHIGLAEDFTAVAAFSEARNEAELAKSMAIEINDTEQLAAALSILAELKFETGDTDGASEEIQSFLALSDQIGEPIQQAKILLVGQACGMRELPLNEIDELLTKTPKIGSIVTRFRAMGAIKTSKNPELWLAQLDEAIRKSRLFFLLGETWRLLSLKARFLDLMGEKYESAREIDKLKGEISYALTGLTQNAQLLTFLQITPETENKTERRMDTMTNASREERLEVLIRVARTVNTIRELDPLLNKIMDLALETLGGERGFIMLYSDSAGSEEKVLEPKVARNLAREDILGETTISHSSAMDVAGTGKPLLLGRSEDQVDPRQSMVTFRISSLLCAPLAVKGEVLGIVYVDSRSGKTFTNNDLDFLVSFADLAAIAIENASLSERLSEKNSYLQKQVESIWGFGNIVGRSAAMQKVFRMAESVAETDVTVVIAGDSGTGKELLARAIHFASPRKKGRFVPVDCGAMAETLLESELFGYLKGAFTGAASDREGLFEAAAGGTVFLDEISNTSKNFQAKLLRVLQESEIRRVGDNRTRKVDVRVIAATNKDLEGEVKSGNFREDLYYRLNVVNIILPLLKDRSEDIPVLASYFLEKICDKMKIPHKTFSSQALDAIQYYPWPGNVRQLENMCERATIFAKGSIINLDVLPAEIRSYKVDSHPITGDLSIPQTKAELKNEKAKIERLFLLDILNRTDGNVMEASRLSGMDRSQIHHLMSRLGISSADFKKSG